MQNYQNNNNNNNYRRDRGGGGGGGGARYGSRGGGGGGGGRGGGRNRVDPNLPWESGVVCSLKDSFGFIYCADRPEEVFFHYSQLSRSDFPSVDNDLQMDQEVTFQIGPSKSGVAAYNVKKCEAPIEWEICEGHEKGTRFQGLVEKSSSSMPPSGFGGDRFGSGGSGGKDRPGANHNANMDGTIRVLMQETVSGGAEAADDDAANKEGDGDAPASEESKTLSADGPEIRFTMNDYQPAASNSNERGNRAPRLLKGDLLEFEIVTDRRTKEKYARKIVLLQSEKERARLAEEQKMLEEATEEHGIITSLKGDYGFLKSNKRREEIFFHYSTIQLEGDEETEHGEDGELVLKEGQDMKFLVVEEGKDNGQQGDRGGKLRRRVSARQVKMQPRGSVQFHDAIARCRTGVVLYPPQPHDSGHLLDQHGKIRLHEPVTVIDPETGGDKEVTEVYLHIKDAPGGSYAFRGGTSMGMWVQAGDMLLFDVVQDFVDGSCHAGPTTSLTPSDKGPRDDDEIIEPSVRMIELALAMRAEGVINNLKDTYGFLHYSERPVDVHFKLFQVMPDSLQRDLRRNMLGYEDKDTRPLKLEVGTEVSFDLSVHGTIHATGGNHNHRNRKNASHERENLKAQRILFLPPKSIITNKVLGKTLEGVIAKQDTKQPYAGTVELKDTLTPMTLEERHPLVAKMIDKYLADTQDTEPLIFHDIQTAKEDDVVFQLIESKAPQKLKWRHTTDADKAEVMQPAGKLVLTKISGDEPAPPPEANVSDDNASVDQTDVMSTASSDFGDMEGKPPGRKNRKKGRNQRPKIIKTVRYDKGSLSSDLRKDVPPNVGDKVVLDVIQSRRAGVVSVSNMKIVERMVPEEGAGAVGGGAAEEDNTTMGVVTEVVSQRKFGFISVMDETATKRESLFFQFSAVENGSKSNGPPLRKGDEVRFKIGTEKNGKRVALHVTTLPRGTIPSRADKNACTGIVLLEPTHTELKNTKKLNNSNSTASNQSNGSSRWDSGDDKQKEEVPITEQGCVLLTSDPTNMFAPKGDDEEEKEGGSQGDVAAKALVHLYYKNGAIAIHGSGSSSSTSGDDGSHPKRGDLVSFVKSKKEGGGLKDVRIATRNASTRLRGKLCNIQLGSEPSKHGTAQFVLDHAKDSEPNSYDISLSEVVGCELTVLKENEKVEAIRYEEKLYGICRTADLYLESKIVGSAPGSASKERPRLNLTVKKDRGGKIMAQSMMAKGPDGTNGFAPGWTTRVSKYAVESTE